jgi:molybdate transport system substrate-binding protein
VGVDDLIKNGKLASRVGLARSGIGVAVHKGASKPQLKSAADFTKVLLEANSIAWVEQGATAAYLKSVFERLGIADQIMGKIKNVQSAAEAVEDGQADVGLTQVSEILPHKNAELAGPLPHDIQKFTTFAVGVRSQDSEASAAFL